MKQAALFLLTILLFTTLFAGCTGNGTQFDEDASMATRDTVAEAKIFAFTQNVCGISKSGDIVFLVENEYTERFLAHIETGNDIVKIIMTGSGSSGEFIVLLANGTVYMDEDSILFNKNQTNAITKEEIAVLTEITDIAYARDDCLIALKNDGNVEIVEHQGYANYPYRSSVKDWRDIISIVTVGDTLVGLSKDGKVYSVDLGEGHYNKNLNESDELDVSAWSDITAIYSNHYDEVLFGLRSDGTVVAVYCGYASFTEFDVSSLNSIIILGGYDGIPICIGKDYKLQFPASTDPELQKAFEQLMFVYNISEIIAIASSGEFSVLLYADGSVAYLGDIWGLSDNLELDDNGIPKTPPKIPGWDLNK